MYAFRVQRYRKSLVNFQKIVFFRLFKVQFEKLDILQLPRYYISKSKARISEKQRCLSKVGIIHTVFPYSIL